MRLDAGELWVSLPTVVHITNSERSYRTFQTWARRGKIRSRISPRGVLEVPLGEAIRLHRTRPVRPPKARHART